ncbi:MAG: VOC family protein [Emcibacteraceae bacterium]|nr:VOC family protein [Emcibacteraceae bacterium]
MFKKWVMALTLLPLMACAEQATEVNSSDTQFLVVGKTANYRQDPASGDQEMINYHFFAEIFVKEGGHVTSGTLSNPKIDVMNFHNHPSVLETHGGRYENEEDLNALYPNGEYMYEYTETGGNVLRIPVVMSQKDDGKTRIPASPIISLSQNGEAVMSANIDPNQDLNISWTPFVEGGADENGFVDDLIFAVVANCQGEKISHSGVPFGGGAHLTYADQDVTISRDLLNPGEVYSVSVEHAVMDTNYVGNVPTIATYAATSFVDFNTSGENVDGLACTALPIQMDKGQTDRSLKGTMDLPKIDEQITMLYYSADDFDKAVKFYGGDLQLEATYDDAWVKIYKLNAGAFVGVVMESDGGFHKPNKDSAVMVSIVSKNVDDWYGAILNAKNIKIEKEIYDNQSAPIRAFLIRDPGGYTVEFFQWMTK